MYCIALIQNESEMMRYSWADVRPMIERIQGYRFDGYTTENIEELFPKLSTTLYDAIIIASNACNDRIIRNSLEKHSQEIDSFLQKGKGLLISFQMKKPEFEHYEFLPDKFKISATNRKDFGENPQDGNLDVGQGQDNHTILCYPKKIDPQKVKQHSLTNNLVEGIYWTYLTPKNPENYKNLIEDNSYNPSRSLLLVSREDYTFRIAVSTIAMDWQGHDDLWNNTVKYVVEGRPSIAVIHKSGRSIFDFRYLMASLEINKVSYAEYILDSMDLDSVAIDIHDSYLLSPSWTPPEIDKFINAFSHLDSKGQAEVFFFSESQNGTPIIQTVSNYREFEVIARNSITWLISQFPQDEKQGYWDESFWTTVDVLNTMIEFDIPILQFKPKILKSIDKKDKNGSYDEVLGATCAMFEVYDLFLGRDHEKTQRALDWIQGQLPKKILFERSTAYEILVRLNIDVLESDLLSFKNEIVNSVEEIQNEFKLYRYGRTLLACGFVNEATKVATQLEKLQDNLSGKWVNIPNTAAIIDFLIELQTKNKNPNESIDEMIFKGVQYLKYTYTPEQFSWNQDISATAKSLKALRSFEQKIKLPIDAVRTAMETVDFKAKNYIAIESASELNYKLLNEVNTLTHRCQNLQNSFKSLQKTINKLSRFSAVSIIVIILSSVYLLLFVKHLTETHKLTDFLSTLKNFSTQSLLIMLIPVVAIALLALLVYLLKKLDKLPRWMESIISGFFEIKD